MIDTYRNLDWGYIGPALLEAIGDTIYMVAWAFAFGGIIGLVIGLTLYTTREGGLLASRPVWLLANFVVNLIRPIPFVILIAALQPLTIAVIGSGIGNDAVVFVMIWASTFAIARIVEQNLVSIDPGVIEAARAMGASPLRIIFTVIIPEALGPLILGATFMFIAIVDMSAMAGYVGAGGLGDFAIQYGYRAFDNNVTYVTLVVIIVIVQIAQLFGNWLARRIMRR